MFKKWIVVRNFELVALPLLSPVRFLAWQPAGIPCIQLDEHYGCQLFGKPERPAFCGGLQPSLEMCGTPPQPRTYAIAWAACA